MPHFPSEETEEEKQERIRRRARLLEAKLSGKHYSEKEPYVPQSAEDLDRLRKRLQNKEAELNELPFKQRLDMKGKVPSSNPESHKKKRSRILEESKDPDYFLDSVNSRLDDLRNEIVELERSLERKLNDLSQEIVAMKKAVRTTLRSRR